MDSPKSTQIKFSPIPRRPATADGVTSTASSRNKENQLGRRLSAISAKLFGGTDNEEDEIENGSNSRLSSSPFGFNGPASYGTPFGNSPKHYFSQQLHEGTMAPVAHGQITSYNARELEEHLSTRFENLQEMRPYRLIGKSEPLADWPSLKKDEAELKDFKKSVRKFYERQNDLIDRYMEVDALLDSGISLSMMRVYGADLPRIHAPDDARRGAPANIDTESSPLIASNRQEEAGVVMFAIYVNFVVNVVLLAGKVVVAVLTNSLSVIASLVDSILDFMSTVIIWASTRLVGQSDWSTRHMYPVGRKRLEPIGVLVFSILIIVSFLQIANEAVQKLWKGTGDVVQLGIPSFVIMLMTVVVKVFCWLWCRTINSSAVQALAQDAATDVIFNTFSIIFPLLSFYTRHWWFDPLGALLLSCYIIYSWGATALEHINNLTGTAADPDDRQVLLYTSFRFAETIRQITNLNAYHTGDHIMVEVDLVLDGTLNLKDSHDIGEALQYALETLPFVERAFVHLDYRTGNFTGHLNH